MSTKIKVLRPYFWSAERIETKAVGHLSYTVCLIIHYGVPLELSILAIACFRTSWVNWYHIGNGCHYQQSANYLFFHLLGTISPFCVTTLLTTYQCCLCMCIGLEPSTIKIHMSFPPSHFHRFIKLDCTISTCYVTAQCIISVFVAFVSVPRSSRREDDI